MSCFWFFLTAVFSALALYPFSGYGLSLWLLRKRLARPVLQPSSAPPLSYALCVCAYNEENIIRQKAENMLTLKKAIPNLNIYVYVDCASDKTPDILREYADDFTLHIATQRHGKTYGMNLLSSLATEPVLVFTDANVMLDVTTFPRFAHYFQDPSVGCVGGHLVYVNSDESVTAGSGSLYWRLEEWLKQMESDTGSVMGLDGSLFAMRRSIRRAPPDDLLDDMYVSLMAVCDGYRVVTAPDIVAYEKSVPAWKDEFFRKARIACQAFNAHRALWPSLRQLDGFNRYKYISHKLIRWFVAYWITLAALCFELGMIAAGYGLCGIVLMLAGCGVLWSGWRARIFPFAQVFDILLAFAGTGLGILQSLLGQRYQTWALAASIREAKT